MVEAAMNDMEAYLTTIIPDRTPCLSCLFPEKPDWDKRGFGVLGAVSGTLACLTALEAIKLITGIGKPLLSQLLTMDLGSLEFAKRRPTTILIVRFAVLRLSRTILLRDCAIVSIPNPLKKGASSTISLLLRGLRGSSSLCILTKNFRFPSPHP
ncbi:MAG: hypothetical protein CLLPBCKN_005509 [Chroococcidiopsis cubana SAG 39.79]|nr:hypothetical protein [Chroococcidiopsis cubana]MDZ4876089.1 hypothetical protein [Chroococcidiopsis cubana SAG 39.79]